jgi:hypothetical protein
MLLDQFGINPLNTISDVYYRPICRTIYRMAIEGVDALQVKNTTGNLGIWVAVRMF